MTARPHYLSRIEQSALGRALLRSVRFIRSTNTPGHSQHVLKAECYGADATDREQSPDSPSGGSMGAAQPAAAGRTGYLKIKPGDVVAVLNLGAPAPRGIVQEVVRREGTYALVRLAPGWLHTCGDLDNLLRLRVSPDEVTALRAKLYAPALTDPGAHSLLRTLTLAHNEISAMSTVAGFGLLTEHTLDALETEIAKAAA